LGVKAGGCWKLTRDAAEYEARMKKYERDAVLGRKKLSDQLTEETVHQSIDWVERGGVRRLLVVLKVIAVVFLCLLATLIVVLSNT